MSARAVVLAAGKGTRMKSAIPKVLHEICGRPMLWWTLRALRDAGVGDVVVVVSPEVREAVAAHAAFADGPPRTVVQQPQRGTGHAVQVALAGLAPSDGALVVAYGDMPLVEASVFRAVIDAAGAAALALVTARMPLPSQFGRVLREGERVRKIVEVRDATPAELAVDEMNAGIYAYREAALRATIGELRDDNAQGELYLTDTVELLIGRGEPVVPVTIPDFRMVLGVNDRVELATARAELNRRLCETHMRAGVTIVDPATTYLEPDLVLAADVTILPQTSIAGRTSIAAGATVGPNTRLVDATIGARARVCESVVLASTVGAEARVGPFAQLRGGAVLEDGVHIGNFVEVKASRLHEGVKAGHLTYLGDAEIGARSNIGAGTITCNYDGERKNRTEIGAGAFIGSNSSLVAPVTIGDGALTGAGAVVIRDVPPGARVVGNPARALPAREPT